MISGVLAGCSLRISKTMPRHCRSMPALSNGLGPRRLKLRLPSMIATPEPTAHGSISAPVCAAPTPRLCRYSTAIMWVPVNTPGTHR
ncbi:hypothetical protein D3C78_1339370 [compost metagenome]